MSQKDAFSLLNGETIVEEVDLDYVEKVYDKVGDAPDILGIQRQLNKIYSDRRRTLLNTPTEED